YVGGGMRQGLLILAAGLLVLAFTPGQQGQGQTPKGQAGIKELATLRGHTAEVLPLAFSPDGKTLFSGSVDHTINLWELAPCKERAPFRGHTNTVGDLSFSPDGRTLASASYDHTIRLWRLPDGKASTVLRGHTNDIFAVAYSPDGRTLASGASD